MHILFLLFLLLIAVLMDLRTYKIKNQLILIGILHGTCQNLYRFPLHTFWQVLGSFAAILLLLLPLFALCVLGAGDVKLFCVIALHFGFLGTLRCIVIALFIGAGMGIAKALWYRRRIRGEVIPFSIPILGSVILYLCMR